MYEFKIMVTTITLLIMIALVCSALGSKGGAKLMSFLLMLVYALCIIAIWG